MWNMSFFQVMTKGGPVMWVILVCSVFALAIILEKLWHLHKIKINIRKFLHNIFDCLRANDTKGAIKVCDSTKNPLGRIFKPAIIKNQKNRNKLEELLQENSFYEIPRLERRLTGLATIAHITPLLGLLGTVSGMVKSFQIVQLKATALNTVAPADLAGGIWEALLTTVAGLIVAIPTFVAYNYLVSRVNNVIFEMERTSTELVKFMSEEV
ncbi:MAG: MotA/TolQ/ExbB proton channel family protein [Candidatus Gygaella obscura]|nr:MotA/TolQ/ExbB proton channel family protein [Candidatus Gygaella obscura]